MAISLESLRDFKAIEFRAPPPSPVGPGHRSSVANDDVLSEFLEHSLRVPDLVLPDRVFPRQKPAQKPPKLDFKSLEFMDHDSFISVVESIGQIGCFELVNHGVPKELIESVTNAGAGIFEISDEKKAELLRSSERPYGFVESHGDQEEKERSEEFVWCLDKAMKLEMEGFMPHQHSNFRNWKYEERGRRKEQEQIGSICYLYKHCHNLPENQNEGGSSSLKYEVIRMLIRGSEYPHALCFHICHGSSEFHLYSKKGWLTFSPDKDALVVTVGDQLQAWSGGNYKHVIGRPIFSSEVERNSDVSMAFLYSPPTESFPAEEDEQGKAISLKQQALFALLLMVFYHFFF
uniref:Non-haem dioxygenase N-terminal domain-containing protein n=1 Tax=Daucus carota subsp. sativus TaxID=79200 RepID=A0A164XBA1_DAUCS